MFVVEIKKTFVVNRAARFISNNIILYSYWKQRVLWQTCRGRNTDNILVT